MDIAVVILASEATDGAQLARAIDSVVMQGTQRRIHLVVAGGPAAVVGEFARQHGNPAEALYVTALPGDGAFVEMANAALAAATEPYIALLDPADQWARDKLELQMRAIRSADHAAAVHTAFRLVDAAGHPQEQDHDEDPLDNPCVGWCVDSLLEKDQVLYSSLILRREVLLHAAESEPHTSPLDAQLAWPAACDDLLLRMARLGRFVYVPEPLVDHRPQPMDALESVAVIEQRARVRLNFALRHAESLRLSEAQARRIVGQYLYRRAQRLFNQRQMAAVRQLEHTAANLGLEHEGLAALCQRAHRPRWVNRLSDIARHLFGG